MIRIPAVIATILALGPSQLFAQDAACHHADKTYSAGSLMMMGKVPYKCGPSESGQMRWATVSAESDANCLYAGEEYGRGALIVVDIHTLNCSSGQWFIKK